MRRHSAGDASCLAALLLPHILPVCSVVAPCQPGASPPSVLRRIYEMSSSDVRLETALELGCEQVIEDMNALEELGDRNTLLVAVHGGSRFRVENHGSEAVLDD